MSTVDSKKHLRVALVHDYIFRYGGAERVLFALHQMFPQAPIYTVFTDKNIAEKYFPEADIRTSFFERFPGFFKKRYRFLAPLVLLAVEGFDLSGFDLVISSSSAFAKGVLTRPETLHVSYCHTPTRFLWDWTHPYTASYGSKWQRGISRFLLHFLRIWDFEAAKRPDFFIANSLNVQKRIAKFYRRSSRVIYPPVSLPAPPASSASKAFADSSYFLIVSYLQKYKSVDVAVEAFNKLGYPLVIIGEGPERKHLEKIAMPNIKFLGWQEDELVSAYLAGCKAFIFPTDEDFGIAPVEAMLAGKPVIALRRGGALEYVREWINGEFFDDSHPAVLADGVRRVMQNYAGYDPALIKNSVVRFLPEHFRDEMREYISGLLEQKQKVTHDETKMV